MIAQSLLLGLWIAAAAAQPSPAPRTKARVAPKPVAHKVRPPIVIHARGAKAPATEFVLKPAAPGTLTLSFVAHDRKFDLDPAAPMVIQINTLEGLTIDPSIITRGEWPKKGRSMTLRYRVTNAAKANRIAGAASYRVCEKANKRACAQVKDHFVSCVGTACTAPAQAKAAVPRR